MLFEDSLAFAEKLDQQDPLAHMRDAFHVPKMTGSDDKEIYFCGNSLGLQPKLVTEYIQMELEKWQTKGVKGHFSDTLPWLSYHENLATESAKLVGASKVTR